MSRHEVLLPSAGSFQILQLMPKRSPNRPKRACSLLPLILTLGDTQDWQLSLGSWNWLHPVEPASLQKRADSTQDERGRGKQKEGSSPICPEEYWPLPFTSPSQDAESTRIYWPTHQTGQPQMTWWGGYGFLPFCR